MFEKIIKLIYPPKCVLCEEIVENDDTLCVNCWKKINFIEKPFCDKCSAPFEFKVSESDFCLSCIKNKPLYVKSRSAVVYDNNSAPIIFKFKFYDKMHLKRFMAKCIMKSAADIIDYIDIFIPIPMHKKRLMFRKYNQSLLLVEEMAKLTSKQYLYDFLLKTKNTTPQAHLAQNERKTNLKNKFIINSKYLMNIEKYKNLNFAIVDDVITTGSTMNECIKTLNEAGIKNVYSLSFAKTVIS